MSIFWLYYPRLCREGFRQGRTAQVRPRQGVPRVDPRGGRSGRLLPLLLRPDGQAAGTSGDADARDRDRRLDRRRDGWRVHAGLHGAHQFDGEPLALRHRSADRPARSGFRRLHGELTSA